MLSAIILTKNEEAHILDVMKSVAFCDEIVVIDNESDDGTATVAKKAGAAVYPNDSADFSVLRNFGMEKAKGDWLLFIDADERVTDDLAQEIKKTVAAVASGKDRGESAYFIRREDIFWGKPVHYGEVRKAYMKGIIRFVRKGSGMWKGSVHEVFALKEGIDRESSGRMQNPLQHLSHTGIHDFLEDISHYSTLRAEELYKAGETVGVMDVLVRPFAKFIYTYWFLQGFRDGAAGFVYSFMMSFHAFLTRSKLYLLKAKRSSV